MILSSEDRVKIEHKVQAIMALIEPWLADGQLHKAMALTALQTAAGRIIGQCSKNDDEVVNACCYVATRLPEIAAMEFAAKTRERSLN